MFELVCRLLTDLNITLLLVAGLIGAAYVYSTWTYGYWSALGIPCPSTPLPLFGHTMSSTTERVHSIDEIRDLYHALGDRRFGGIYTMRTPQLLVKDSKLVGHVLIKDFDHFTDRGIYAGTHINPLNNNIFFEKGERWKTMRQKISPTFTANKLKHMNTQVSECTYNLLRTIGRTENADETAGCMEIRDIMAKYSTDVIGSCAFGLQLDAINDPDSEFRKHGKKVFRPSWASKIRMALVFTQPWLLKVFRLNNYPLSTAAFFRDAFHQTIEHRQRHPDPERKDFVYHLMKAREELVLNPSLRPEEKFTEMDIVANAHILFIAGFETVSTSMSCCMYELALEKNIQDKVRNEILEVKSKNNGEINSECMKELHYMSMVIKETLRKYPPLSTLNRIVTKPYTIPGTDIKLKTGTKIIIPVYAIHYDSKYYPNPDDFDPERFSEENIHKIHPNTYMPFGDGPRFCVGKRFAEFEMKMALSEILSEYEVMPCDKTQIPVKFTKGSFITIPESIWLKLKKLRA